MDKPHSHAPPENNRSIDEITFRLLKKLYSASSSVPIIDRTEPAFELEAALKRIVVGLRESGFYALDEKGTTVRASASRDVEDKSRKVFARRQSPDKATEMVVVDCSSREKMLHPLKDIIGPKPILQMSSAYLSGIPSGLVGTKSGDVPQSSHDRSVQRGPSSKQVFLPYYDPVRDRRGWQFSFPGEGSSEDSRFFSALILTRDAKVFEVKRLDLRPGHASPSEPVWGWPPAHDFENIREARLAPPHRSPDSAPLSLLPESSQDATRFLPESDLPVACQRSRGLAPFTPNLKIRLPGVFDGLYEVKFGPWKLCTAKVKGQLLTSLRPSRTAHQLDLWTCHLLRSAQTYLLDNRPL